MGQAPSEASGSNCGYCSAYLHGVGNSWDNVDGKDNDSISYYTFRPPGHQCYYRRKSEASPRCYKCFHDPNWKTREQAAERERAKRKREEDEKAKREKHEQEQEKARREKQKQEQEKARREEERQDAQKAAKRMAENVETFLKQDNEQRAIGIINKRSHQKIEMVFRPTFTTIHQNTSAEEVTQCKTPIEDILQADGNQLSKETVVKVLDCMCHKPEVFQELTSDQFDSFKIVLGELLLEWFNGSLVVPSFEVFQWIHMYLLELYFNINCPELDTSGKDNLFDVLADVFNSVANTQELVKMTQILYTIALKKHDGFEMDAAVSEQDQVIARLLYVMVLEESQTVPSPNWNRSACNILVDIFVPPALDGQYDYRQALKRLINENAWTPMEVISLLLSFKDIIQGDDNQLAKAFHQIVAFKMGFTLLGETVLEVLVKEGSKGLFERTSEISKADTNEEKGVQILSNEILKNNWADSKVIGRAQKIVIYIQVKLRDWGYPGDRSSGGTVKQTIDNELEDMKDDLGNIFEDDELLSELVALMCYGVRNTEHYWPRATQLLSLTLLLTSKETLGRLVEIATGEGKSCIISMFAAILVLHGMCVDIVTSSPVLAKRDSEKWLEFYSLFDISTSHNTALETIADRRSCYRADIVYGTVGAFASDILRQEFHMEMIRQGRETADSAVIVDEVDFMLLDRGVQFTYLSHRSLGFRHLDPIFALIWNAVSRFEPIQISGSKYYGDRCQPFYQAIGSALDDSEISISQLLKTAEEQDILGSGFCEEFKNSSADKLLSDVKTDHMIRVFNLLDVFDLYTLQEVRGELRPVIVPSDKDRLLGENNTLAVLVLDKGLCMVLTKDDGSLQAGISAKILEFLTETEDSVKINIPKHLVEFVENRVPVWVRSAFHALQIVESREYLVQNGNVLPIDFKATGIVETNKKWSDGLQQFVELKHGLQMSQVSLVTNFMSNLEYFKRYKENLYGVSGTIGSETDQIFLKNEFNVDLCHMPTHKVRKLYEDKGKILTNQQQWLSAIVEEINTEVQATPWRDHGRAALIICEDIKTAEVVSTELQGNIPGQVHTYTGSGAGRDKLPDTPLSPGDVIVATNLAGRGTDIKVTDEVNNSGGLLVLVTFLPSNTRIEMQAFGRTGRKGLPGSAKILLNSNRIPDIYRQFADTVEDLKIKRRELEKEHIELMVKTEIADCIVKESLFSRYCFHLQRAIKSFNKPVKQAQLDKDEIKLAISFLHEKWGLWLQMNSDELGGFKEKLLSLLDEMTENAIKSVERKESPNVYHITRFGNEHLVDEEFKKANEFYNKAVNADIAWTSIALYNRAYCKINLAETGYMTSAKKDLQESLGKLANYKEELQQILMNVNCSKQASTGEKDLADIQKDVEMRESVIDSFEQNITEAIGQLESLKDKDENAVTEASSPITLAGDDEMEKQGALCDLWEHGLLYVFSVKKKPEFCWSALAAMFIGFAQVALGVFLTAISGGALIGIGKSFIEAGVSDVYAGIEGMIKGTFDWVSWGIGKAISLVMNLITMGIGAIIKKGANVLKLIKAKGFIGAVKHGAKTLGKSVQTATKTALAGTKTALKANIKLACVAAGKELIQQGVICVADFAMDKAEDEVIKGVEEHVIQAVKGDIMEAAVSGNIADSIQRVATLITKGKPAGIDDPCVKKQIQKGIFARISSDITHQYTRSSEWGSQLVTLFENVIEELEDTHEGNKTFALFKGAYKAANAAATIVTTSVKTAEIVNTFDTQVAKKANEYCEKEEKTGDAHEDTTEVITIELDANNSSLMQLKKDIGQDLAKDLGGAIMKVWKDGVTGHARDYVKDYANAKMRNRLGTDKIYEDLGNQYRRQNTGDLPEGQCEMSSDIDDEFSDQEFSDIPDEFPESDQKNSYKRQQAQKFPGYVSHRTMRQRQAVAISAAIAASMTIQVLQHVDIP